MKKPIRRVPGDSPVDIGSDAIIRYRKSRKATLDDLYDWLCAAGLNSEEASEMCNLEQMIEDGEL